ncbi:MAG: hypothetical protein CMH54_05215 [Myxococcales bacterium]|nr:hypothetical protein [Myxococcales bacterium]
MNPPKSEHILDMTDRTIDYPLDFRFRCFDCVYWRSEPRDCVLGYPVEELIDTTQPIRRADGQWVTCKDFELD